MRNKTNQLVKMGLLAAMSVILITLIHFPILPAAPFMEYDPADVPILIGTFLYGPLAGLIITTIAALIQALTVSASSGWIGFLMHVMTTGTFVLVAGSIYRKYHSFRGGVVALVCGSLARVLVMIPANLIFVVLFLGVPRDVVLKMLIPTIIPFNLIKAGINSVLTLILYKSIANFLRSSNNKNSVDHQL